MPTNMPATPSAKLLLADSTALGTFAKIPSPEVVEMVARAGFDFVVIDTEHALLSVREVYEMIIGYSAHGVAAYVRTTDHSQGDAQRYLDAGASGVFLPHVENAQQAATIAERLTFPPRGNRGMGYVARAGLWGALPGGPMAYVHHGEENVARVAMIEDAGAVEALDEIAATDGIDAIFIGPGDLAMAVGATPASPTVEALITRALASATAAGIPVGVAASGPAEIRLRREQGATFILASSDAGIIGAALRGFAEEHRTALADPDS